jgi:flavin-dependent dehydrogenase
MDHESNGAMRPDIAAEICVLGGGPAGAVVARRLAELGHDTLLIDRTAGAKPPRAESLAPSILPILESLHLRDDIEAAVFRRERQALLLWGSRFIHEKTFADAPSLLIERTGFDTLLRRAATRAGVRLMAPARARAPQHLASGGWAVPVATPAGASVIKAAFLVDARGKRAHGCDDSTPRTAAMSALWSTPDQFFAQTRIEAGFDAWFWGSPSPGSCYAATIFLESQRIAGASTANRAETYRHLLAQSKLLNGLLRGEMIGPVRVRDATSRISPDLIGNDFIRVGEAAIAIDPLSSQGIQDAILSAIQASAAVHTILTAGCAPAAALEFYRDRRHSAAANSRMAAARFYRAHPEQSSFWIRRSTGPERPVSSPLTVRAAGTLPSELCASRALQIVDIPVLSGAFIERARALSHPRLEQPIAYFAGVALAPLIDEASGVAATEQILSRWTQRMPIKTARNILDWMWAVGILEPRAGACEDHATSARR